MGDERTMTNETKKGAAAGPLGPGQRWSLSRKREVVLRLLKGEPLDALSRELGVELHRLEAWRDRALSGMELGLKEREADDPTQQELDKAHKRIGELSMENELLRKERDKTPPFRSRKSRR
jgi:transposase